jgi:hypothetical protein
MKKTLKKLSLSRETLRTLTDRDSRVVEGAGKSGDTGYGTICSDCAPASWTCRPPM